MSQHLHKPLLALLMAVPMVVFAVPQARADSELFASTEVTVRYDVIGWVKRVFTPNPELAMDIQLRAIEPAAGHGSEAPAKDEAPAAHGSSEGKKSFAGKQLSAPPPLPMVTIGGKAVISLAQSQANDLTAVTPDGLDTVSNKETLERRFSIRPYAHSPVSGNPDAPLKVVQFVDLSCGQCMPELAKIDAALHDVSLSMYVVHIHAPMERFQDTNMPAFYGKIADKAGLFWTYRANLIQDKPVDANAVFDELIKSGMDINEARSMMMTEARRFYRELDADSLLARSFGVGKPPVLFVNGIRVGNGGIPLEKLPDVLKYVSARIERGLAEPPK